MSVQQEYIYLTTPLVVIILSSAKGNICHGVFLDVSAAFDKCWHSGLLAKLAQVKVSGTCLDLFTSYLSSRKQFVVVDGWHSDNRAYIAKRAANET